MAKKKKRNIFESESKHRERRERRKRYRRIRRREGYATQTMREAFTP